MACGLMRAHSDAPRRRRHAAVRRGLPVVEESDHDDRARRRRRCGLRWPFVPHRPDVHGDDPLHRAGLAGRAARRLRAGWLDDRRADDAGQRRLGSDDPRERPAGDRLQVRRRRHVGPRSREPAQEPRQLRRVQLGHARRLQPLPAARRDRLARRDHVLRDGRSLLRRRSDATTRPSPASSFPASTRAATSRACRTRSRTATSISSASTRCGSRRRSTTPTTRTPAPTATTTPAITATGRRTSTTTESHFGTEADLKAMVDAAHEHHIQVLIDYVMNHVHDTSPVYAAAPRLVLADDNGHGGNCVCGDGCNWDTDRTRCWFDHVPARLQLQERRRAPVVGRQRGRVGQAHRHRRLPARRGQARRDLRGSPICARASMPRSRWDQQLLHGRRDVRRQPRPHQVVRRSGHDARRSVRLPAARPGARRRCCAATAR